MGFKEIKKSLNKYGNVSVEILEKTDKKILKIDVMGIDKFTLRSISEILRDIGIFFPKYSDNVTYSRVKNSIFEIELVKFKTKNNEKI